jgi:ribonuclease R
LGDNLNYMDFSIATLLSHFSDDKLIALKILEKKLGCEDESSVQQLGIVLDVLNKIGVIAKDKGKYRKLVEEDVVEAKLRCSSKGFCFAIQDDEGAEDIYIRESHLSNAWNGDRVLIKVMKEGTRRRSPEGIVKLILERANPSVLARLKQDDSGHYQAVPLDDRLLCELEVLPEGQDLSYLTENLVQVEVLRYQIGQEPPLGKVARILGTSAESASDVDIVCCKHDLRSEFPSNVVLAGMDLPIKVSAKVAKGRQDLTDLLTFAVGEADQFWENAFSLTTNEDGTWQVGVHIADVASYINADDRLDREARKRGTAVYVGDLIIPLLPAAVHQACGFNATAQRLAVSVLMTVNGDGQVTEFAIRPSLIKVAHCLSYEQLEESLAGQAAHLPPAVTAQLQELLQTVAPALRRQRQQQGGLDVNLLASQTRFADEGRLGAVFVDESRSAITELAIAANRAIASHLQALGVPGIYSVQYHPELAEINDLIKLVQNLGLSAETEVEAGASDLQRISQTFDRSPVPRVLNYIFKSMLKTAIYSAQPGNHFGLGINDGYVHAVSPLSRYADLLNQRILHEVFTNGRDRRSTRTKESVDLQHSSCHGQINWNVLTPSVQQELAAQIAGAISHLNDREKIAQDAENDLQGLQKAEQMQSRTGQIFQGLITGVQSYGFFVEIEDFLVEGLVHVSSLKDDWYEFRPRYACLVGRKNRITYRLGDRVEVQVKSVDYYRQQIDLATVTTEVAPDDLAPDDLAPADAENADILPEEATAEFEEIER